MIAQKDVVFSNSMIEALNKVIKQQFLYPLQILSRTSLDKILAEIINVYNSKRPQMHLQGNTPFETYNGTPIDFGRYTVGFSKQKRLRILENQKNRCKVCIK
jgi:putative transposase